MPDSPVPPVSPTQPPQAQPTLPQVPTVPTIPQSPPPTVHTPASKRLPGVFYFALLAAVLLGISGTYAFFIFYKPVQPQKKAAKTDEVSLPSDAVQIQTCADGSGSLYIRPKDIPTGPVYMVYQSKVIGIEYMLPQSELAKGEQYRDLTAGKMKVDHINIGLLQHGHIGLTVPHYHVAFYTIPQSEEAKIVCAGGSDEEMDMPGMEMESSDSAIPSFTETPSPKSITPPPAMPSGMHM